MVAQAKVFSLTRSSGTTAQSTRDETWRLLEGWVNGPCPKLSIIIDAAKPRRSENWPRSVKRVTHVVKSEARPEGYSKFQTAAASMQLTCLEKRIDLLVWI